MKIMEKGPVMLMILDGFGINEKTDGNAVKLAKTPNIDKLMKKYPNTIMYTSGLKVGLPDGQMGNSEVGHTNIGAGRISSYARSRSQIGMAQAAGLELILQSLGHALLADDVVKGLRAVFAVRVI